MTIDQSFKDKCQGLINDWSTLINSNSNYSYEMIAMVISNGKGKIYNSDFFKECWRWNGEQRAYFYNLLANNYVGGSIRDCINKCSNERGQQRTGWALAEMVDLIFTWFYLVKADRWADMGQYDQAINDKNQALNDKASAERARDQAIADKATAEKVGSTAQTKYASLVDEWNADFTTDFGLKLLSVDSLKDVKAKLDQLKADLKTANDNINTLQTDKATLKANVDKLTSDLTDRDNTIKDKEVIIDRLKDLPDKVKILETSLKGKDAELTQRNEVINTLTTDKAKAEQELDNANNQIKTLEGEKTILNNQLTAKDASITELNNKLINKNDELTNVNNSITTLTNEKTKAEGDLKDANSKIAILENDKTVLNDTIANLNQANNKEINRLNGIIQDLQNTSDKLAQTERERDKVNGDLLQANKDKDDLTTQIKTKEEEIKRLQEQLNQQSNQPKPSNDNKDIILGYLIEKLKKIYAEKIETTCDRWYSDLGLSEEEADSKYGQGYETFLKTDKLNENTDISNVINAFRIVAMITATDKCQELSDKMKKMRKLPEPLKKQRIAYFNKVKDFWKIATDEIKTSITADNNPLYLDIIKDYSISQQQLAKIIITWQ